MTMHIGRSHHLIRAGLSILGGFTASFVAVFVASNPSLTAMKGQLVAGDPSLNRQFPTTLNTFHGAMDGTDSIMHSMSSYGFWVTVTIGGIFLSFMLFKLVRRYV